MIASEHEALRADLGADATDAVTIAFADPSVDVCVLARVGLSADCAAQASALAVVYAAREPVAALADGAIEIDEPAWESITAGGLAFATTEPLRAWTLRLDVDQASFQLELEACSEPAETAAGSVAGAASGMAGYEQLCRVRGSASIQGRDLKIDALGQRGHSWGIPAWDRIEASRTIAVWLDDGRGLTATAARPIGAKGHDEEAVTAILLESDDVESDRALSRATPVHEALLSTTYDGEGRQRRAGLELWPSDDDDAYPRRIAGAARCGSTLRLGRLRLDCAFFDWTMEGHSGIGRYDILRPDEAAP